MIIMMMMMMIMMMIIIDMMVFMLMTKTQRPPHALAVEANRGNSVHILLNFKPDHHDDGHDDYDDDDYYDHDHDHDVVGDDDTFIESSKLKKN